MIWRGYYRFGMVLTLLAVGGHLATGQRSMRSAPRAPTSNLALNQNVHRGLHRSSGPRSASRSPSTSPYASPYTSLPFPFFSDLLDSGDIYSTGYPVASQPPPFLMDAAREMAAPTADSMGSVMRQSVGRESSETQPLMIELQNGRYVSVSSPAINGEALPLNLSAGSVAPAKFSAKQSKRGQSVVSSQEIAEHHAVDHDRPATLLIFRDGHGEEVRDYTIADGALYVRGDFYADGYWNKKIALASLDLPQTLQANASRNVKFVLPTSSNEVIASF